MTARLIDLLKLLLDDFVRERWGDICALVLIFLGIWLLMHGANEIVQDQGKVLIGAGLFALRPKLMLAKNGNGNGNGAAIAEDH